MCKPWVNDILYARKRMKNVSNGLVTLFLVSYRPNCAVKRAEMEQEPPSARLWWPTTLMQSGCGGVVSRTSESAVIQPVINIIVFQLQELASLDHNQSWAKSFSSHFQKSRIHINRFPHVNFWSFWKLSAAPVWSNGFVWDEERSTLWTWCVFPLL